MDVNVESQSESETRCVPEKASKSDSVSTNNNGGTYKPSKKLIRVLTVIGYGISVSLAGVMLSLYYVFLWRPTVNNIRPDGRTATLMSGPALPQALVSYQDGMQVSGIPDWIPATSLDDHTATPAKLVKFDATPSVTLLDTSVKMISKIHSTSNPTIGEIREVSTDKMVEPRQLAIPSPTEA